MKVGDLVRDIRCGTLCVVKSLYHRHAMVWSFSGNEDVEIEINNLQVAYESR